MCYWSCLILLVFLPFRELLVNSEKKKANIKLAEARVCLMSFTWSAASEDVHQPTGDQGTGKRTKTSHYNEVKVPSSVIYNHDGKVPGNSFGDVKATTSYAEAKVSNYTELLHHLPNSNNTITSWDIDGGLAADFDGSLSGLGAELGSTTYNMR